MRRHHVFAFGREFGVYVPSRLHSVRDVALVARSPHCTLPLSTLLESESGFMGRSGQSAKPKWYGVRCGREGPNVYGSWKEVSIMFALSLRFVAESVQTQKHVGLLR